MATGKDIILAAVLLFAIGMGFFAIHFIMTTAVDSFIAVPVINESSDAVAAFEGIDSIVGRLDYLVFGLFIAFVLAIIISSWFIAGNPIFMFIYFIVLTIGVIISTILANTWETMSQAVIFGSTISAFPITNNLLLNLPIYIAAMGFIGLVIMFAKPKITAGREYR